MTPQRRAVAEVLAGEHVHLTAEQVLAAARRIVPEVSQATVYNTLNELVAMGEVNEVRVGRTASQYDPNVRDGHHHLVCTRCGMVFDVHPAGLDGVALSRAERHGFSLGHVELTFRGVCSSCAERSAPGADRTGGGTGSDQSG
jgi:Fur family ferric uptake transcriptional regulator